ncbi:prepilin-type N-terminal cleavage/methylation domain-containing protein [Thermosynechococcus sp. B0]|uniref:type IV pilin-like G/H family protein n=1 Tax=unclassified Thermosynechococcus TaxID=2622553 RepID=UPI002576C210|nr:MULTISPECIES: type IV pilin-like G/H family protein [unclassified Thermosynechococcus]WJI24131.1 prepilin-type N-terminal cleavage/methylation domain-containing protein [Thermosynechococcus sp. B0]WJI26644.1 prepilin-type N-terminal cleavage/methylation domain-containing protein [Thermosynechococcus sp. B1]
MKTELKAKFLQHLLAKKKANEGFTLIELLVVVIIIGILAAIALPSMLNQAAKARLSSAKNTIGAINRAQQAYRLENTEFAPNVTLLKLGVSTPDGYNTPGITTNAGAHAIAKTTSIDNQGTGVTGCVTVANGITTSTIVTGTGANAPDCPSS